MAQSSEAAALSGRYNDAYLVGRTTVGVGTLFNGIGILLGGLIFLGSIAAIASGENDLRPFGFAGIAFGVFVGGSWYVFGGLVCAQGQILKACLDSAVNSSPFLTNDQRADIMTLPKARAVVAGATKAAEPHALDNIQF